MSQPFFKSLLFLFLFSGLGSCSKDSIDFRDKYCGEWNFTLISVYESMSDPVTQIDTSFYRGQIWYDSPNQIKIKYRVTDFTAFDIDKQGNIYFEAYYPIQGEFTDANHVDFSTYSGGLGASRYTQIQGVKL